jgi:hypothetical protein
MSSSVIDLCLASVSMPILELIISGNAGCCTFTQNMAVSREEFEEIVLTRMGRVSRPYGRTMTLRMAWLSKSKAQIVNQVAATWPEMQYVV